MRADNADQRLTPLGIDLGCISEDRRIAFETKLEKLDTARELLLSLTITPNEAQKKGLAVNQDGIRRSAFDLLSYPDMTYERLSSIWPELQSVGKEIAEQVSTDALYAVYLERQAADIEALKRDEALVIPADFNFHALVGLSNEVKQKLDAVRPGTLAQASRMDGITPAALTLLLSHVKRLQPRKGVA